ncbi:hypothetical protein ACIQYS_08515 [Psychrobacillus sp. NPDC096426]|uniref:hypothetical protein n=1 Tax=Psychrobacillus sp. NPDC096426 TaxID=3364491 RepID=UPI00380E6D13
MGIVFAIKFVDRNTEIADLNGMIFIVTGISLFFVMLFILPEQLVILHCKFTLRALLLMIEVI